MGENAVRWVETVQRQTVKEILGRVIVILSGIGKTTK